MDTLFVLGQESRLRILQQAAARIPGCAYLCAWAPLAGGGPASSSSSAAAVSASLLCCLDAWLCDGGARGEGDRVRALFEAYRGSVCAAVSGCVPGWAYKDGRAYMELPEHDLTASASLPAQQQFYQVSEHASLKLASRFVYILTPLICTCNDRPTISKDDQCVAIALAPRLQMAAFMGCESGEIEVGVSTPATSSGMSTDLETSLQQVFSEDFFQQSLLEELLHLPPTRPSSSPSSSLPSVSVDSPAAEGGYTSLLRTTMAAVTSAATPLPSSGREWPVPVTPPPPLPEPFGQPGYVHIPSAEADDAVMARAMLAVISAASTSSSSSLPPPSSPPPPPHHRARRWPRRTGTATAFRAYSAALAPRRQPGGAPGQRMIKMGISILRRMHMLRFSSRERDAGAAMVQGDQDDESPAPSSSQLNHMISERRRRERLNESFEALRGLLPPGSKKDKATVLAKTLEYMNILVAQISDLEARNRTLESRAHQRANGGSKELMISSSVQQQAVLQGLSGTSERVQVHVMSGSASASSSSSSRPQEVTVRVEARAEGDVAELVTRVLAAIRKTGRFTVVAVDARRPSSDAIAHATFTLRATV
ncbi:hypothetical protein EJB05_55842, partial [Eragrostis curvula]